MEIKIETSIVKCKTCNITKTRILVGKYKTGKKWANAEGKQWNGHVCPECNVLRANEGMKKSRTKDVN